MRRIGTPMNEVGGIIRKCPYLADRMSDKQLEGCRWSHHQMQSRTCRRSHEHGSRRIHENGDLCDGPGLHCRRCDLHDQYRTRNAYPTALQREKLHPTAERLSLQQPKRLPEKFASDRCVSVTSLLNSNRLA